MHFNLANAITIVTVLCVLGLGALHRYRSQRRRRHWQASWEEFRYCHRDLDRELNLFWQRQGRP